MPAPKVLVCGSRTWTDAAKIRQRLNVFPSGTTFIAGGARGADALATSIAHSLGFVVTEFPAVWLLNGKYDAKAGFKRNLRMLDEKPDLVLAFWDGASNGTLHTLSQARLRGITTEIVAP